MQKLITITNPTRHAVLRGNMRFPAGSTGRIVFDVNDRKFKEIKACSALRILKMEDIGPKAPREFDPVLKVTDESAVVPPEIVVKDEDVTIAESVLKHEAADREASAKLIKYEQEKEEVAKAAKAAKDAKVLLAKDEPVVVAPAEVAAVTDELEVVAVAEIEESVEEQASDPKLVSCPYCDFTAKAQIGMYPHVRTHHPEVYEEYKVRVHNS